MPTVPDPDEVLVSRAQLDALVGELSDVRTRLAALEAVAPEADVLSEERPAASIGRRAAIAGLFGAAVGSAAALASPAPVAAATGGNLILGQNNTALNPTILDARGSGDTGFYVRNNGGFGVGQRIECTTNAALYGYSTSTGQVPTAGFQNGSDGLALNIDSDGPQLRFQSSTSTNPLTDPEFSYEGTVRGTQNGELWHCVNYGTPGTWRKLSGRTTAGSLHVLPAPARIYDSRPGTLPEVGSKTKLSGNTPRTLDLKVNSSTVPAGATAAVLTVLLVEAANASGNLTVWANGVARPQANTLVWGGSAGRFTTEALTALDTQARIQIAASASTHVVIDVVGYYR